MNRVDLNDPQTAVWGFSTIAGASESRKDLNDPQTAVWGILYNLQEQVRVERT